MLKVLWAYMSPTERNAWRDKALVTGFLNRCGQTIYLSAWRLFCHVNGVLATFGPDYLLTTPPADFDPPPTDVAFQLEYQLLPWFESPQLVATHDDVGEYGFQLWSDFGGAWPFPWPGRKSQLLYRTPGAQPATATKFFVGAGSYYDPSSGLTHPLIYRSQNNGASWITELPGTPVADAYLFGAAGSEDVFVAVGYYIDIPSYLYHPLIYTSVNGGASWTQRAATGAATWLSLYGVAGSGNVFVTVGVFFDAVNGLLRPLIYTSVNGGTSWNEYVPQYISGDSMLYGVAGSGNIFVAVGLCVYRSANGGASWTLLTLFDPATNKCLFGVAGAGANFVAVGHAYDDTEQHYIPLLYTSGNGGVTWTERAVMSADTNTELYGVAGSGNVFVTVGEFFDEYSELNRPLILSSVNSGVTWAARELPGMATDTRLFGVAGAGANFVAVGEYYDPEYECNRPIIYVSETYGETWTRHIPGAPGTYAPIQGAANINDPKIPIGLMHLWRWYGSARYGSCPPAHSYAWPWVYSQSSYMPRVVITGRTVNLANGVGRDVHVPAYLVEP